VTLIDQERPSFQFGVFELDCNSGELRKHGIKLKLQDQPLQVLIFLLERGGQVVTREDLQKRLWPENTYVDFDNAINSAVRKLREALGDSAENPRFVETLARRGYRFIAPVKSWNPSSPGPVPVVPAPTLVPKKRKLAWVSVAAFALLMALGIGVRSWRMNRSGTPVDTPAPAVPLTSYPGFQGFPTFSPEGARVAFAWDEPGKHPSNIYVKLLSAQEPVRLTSSDNGDIAPAWSPDGRFIAFLRAYGPLNSALMIIPAVGGPERELKRLHFDSTQSLAHWGWNAPSPYIAWSPDSKWLLALDQSGPEQPARIVRISVESGDKTRLFTSPDVSATSTRNLAVAAGDGGIAISPNGRNLAYVHGVDAPIGELYLVGLSGEMLPIGRPQRLNFEVSMIGGIAWNQDGRSLIVSSNRRGSPELWRIPISPSGEPVRLNVGGDDPSDVAVSATGRHLAYSHFSTDWNIWRVGLTGAHSKQAESFIASTRNDSRPAYSSDGTRVAFESGRSGSEEIWISNADGLQTVELTSFGKAWAGSPAWSPDGKQIAFDSNAAGNWDVYVIPSNGGKPVRLTTNSAPEIRPNWSHDGKWIYYCSSQTGVAQIWKKPAAGGDGIQVTQNGGCQAMESADGETLYYFQDEESFWKVPAHGGKETEIAAFPRGYGSQFTLAKTGAYFIDSRNITTLKFLDFRSDSVKLVAKLPGPVGDGIAASPDGQWLLYGKNDSAGSQLMLVEKFQ
jgi:Tol biopolymer transport system component/DNA-binding winged helix-turn-helix (wHTH) protein